MYTKKVKFLDKEFEVPSETNTMVVDPDGTVLATNSVDLSLEHSEDFETYHAWVAFPTQHQSVNDVFLDEVGSISLAGYPTDFWKTYIHTV